MKTNEKVVIAGINKLSLVNGDGCRVVVFLQGCAHHCKGCQNPDTWDFGAGQSWEVRNLAAYLNSLFERHPLDGLTLSGGDPMYQEEACLELLRLMPENLNVWMYTGFRYEEIKERPLARRCDVIVDGEYIESMHCEGMPYGSTNQRIIRKENESNAEI